MLTSKILILYFYCHLYSIENIPLIVVNKKLVLIMFNTFNQNYLSRVVFCKMGNYS